MIVFCEIRPPRDFCPPWIWSPGHSGKVAIQRKGPGPVDRYISPIRLLLQRGLGKGNPQQWACWCIYVYRWFNLGHRLCWGCPYSFRKEMAEKGNMLKMIRQGKVQNMSTKPTTVEIFFLRNQLNIRGVFCKSYIYIIISLINHLLNRYNTEGTPEIQDFEETLPGCVPIMSWTQHQVPWKGLDLGWCVAWAQFSRFGDGKKWMSN